MLYLDRVVNDYKNLLVYDDSDNTIELLNGNKVVDYILKNARYPLDLVSFRGGEIFYIFDSYYDVLDYKYQRYKYDQKAVFFNVELVDNTLINVPQTIVSSKDGFTFPAYSRINDLVKNRFELFHILGKAYALELGISFEGLVLSIEKPKYNKCFCIDVDGHANWLYMRFKVLNLGDYLMPLSMEKELVWGKQYVESGDKTVMKKLQSCFSDYNEDFLIRELKAIKDKDEFKNSLILKNMSKSARKKVLLGV